MLPPDIDVCVSLDLDEVLTPGWREEIERVWVRGQTTRMHYDFDWGEGLAFRHEKIHARQGYRWHHPCHEIPVPDRIAEVWAESDKLLVVHKPDPTKPRTQYLDLLRVSIEEDPDCPRNAFYYASEKSWFRWPGGRGDRAAAPPSSLPGATWSPERCFAYRIMGRCRPGGRRRCAEAFKLAIAEAAHTREPW